MDERASQIFDQLLELVPDLNGKVHATALLFELIDVMIADRTAMEDLATKAALADVRRSVIDQRNARS